MLSKLKKFGLAFIFLEVVVALILGLFLLFPAKAEGVYPKSDLSDWFKGLKIPYVDQNGKPTGSYFNCCDISDCHPIIEEEPGTRFKVIDNKLNFFQAGRWWPIENEKYVRNYPNLLGWPVVCFRSFNAGGIMVKDDSPDVAKVHIFCYEPAFEG